MKYAFLGPESTGKTTMAKEIALRTDGVYIPEIARDYLKNIELEYTYNDIIKIALLQSETESVLEVQGKNKIIICDTELITIEIWLEYLNYEVPEWIVSKIEHSTYQTYFLFDIDIPWVADTLRANQHDRREIFNLFESKLVLYGKPYEIIRGQNEERIQNILKLINK